MSTPEKPAAPAPVEEVKGAEGPTIVDPSAIFVPEGEGKGPFYAWTRFIAEREEESGVVTKWVLEGDTVSQSDIDASDEDWEEFVNSGAVRETKYPVPKGEGHLSPNDYYKRELAKAAGDEVE